MPSSSLFHSCLLTLVFIIILIFTVFVKNVSVASASLKSSENEPIQQRLPFCGEGVRPAQSNAGWGHIYYSKQREKLQSIQYLLISFLWLFCNSLLYVSTLDGKVTALDILNGGEQKWSIPTKPSAMISSSIQNLELTNNGQWVRMIPSLSGSLYKFDGEGVEPIPINADNLLSSSFKFSDDLVISGTIFNFVS